MIERGKLQTISEKINEYNNHGLSVSISLSNDMCSGVITWHGTRKQKFETLDQAIQMLKTCTCEKQSNFAIRVTTGVQ